MQRADHARAVKVEEGIDTFVFNDGMIRLRTVRYTLQHTSWTGADQERPGAFQSSDLLLTMPIKAIARQVPWDLPRNRA